MISLSTFVFVLVLVAVASAAAVWIIYERLTQAWVSVRFTTERDCEALRQQLGELAVEVKNLKRSAPVNLADEVAGLAADVERLRETQRRFAGRFDQRMAALDGAAAANETPEQVRDRLRAKHGLPKVGASKAMNP